ncbi:MAG: hypothetical protein ACI9S8_002387 [Chlamydiales bacterium]|jgi:hypothetical protein
MKKFLTVLLMGLTITAGALEAAWNQETQAYDAEWKLDVVPYLGYLKYHNNTTKDTATVFGVYEYIGYGLEHLVELSQDYTKIDQMNTDNYKQLDFTAVYSNFSIPSWKMRVGGHYIDNNDVNSNHTWTGILGAHYIGSYDFDAGLDGFVSKYMARTPTLWVYQFSPHLGIPFWKEATSSWRNDISGNWIYHSENTGLADRHFYSVEETVHYYWDSWTLGANAWLGKQSFAVRKGGFAVFNLAEEYTGGFGAEIKYALDLKTALTFKINREEFKEISTDTKTKVENFMFMLGHSF